MNDEPMERLVRSLKDDLDAAVAERDRLRAVVDATLQGLGEDAPMPELLAEYAGSLLHERNGLETALDAAVATVGRLQAERDRLRAVVEAVRNWRAAQPGHESAVAIQAMNEAFAGGSSTREGEAAPMMAAPSPPAEGAPGTRPPGAPPNHAGVVTYDAEACAAYVSVRPHDRVARTASVHPHNLVMLDYNDDGQLLGVEVMGIMHDEPPAAGEAKGEPDG